jgi:cytochrome c oxidase cbb3-type subunit III
LNKYIVLLLALLLNLSCAHAQDPDDAAQAARNSPAAAGQAVFRQNCGFCHGQDGRGASGPDLIRSTLVNHDVNGNLIAQVVHNGRPEKGMPAFQLPDAQIQQIAAFLHAQAELASTVARRVPTEYPLEKLLVGNADAGKDYFNGAGKCTQCHSPAGDLAHIAAKYKPLELQSRIVFPYGANPAATVTTAAGQQFKGEQIYSDEFLITLRLNDGTQRTWIRRGNRIAVTDPLAAHVALLSEYTDKDIHDLFAYLETLK